MPTYRNNSTAEITITDDAGLSITFTALQTKTTMSILSDSRLTMLYDTPYYNPLRCDVEYTLTEGASATYETSLSSSYLRLIPVSGVPQVYINSVLNVPGIILTEATTIINKAKVSILYISNYGTGDAVINIKEVW